MSEELEYFSLIFCDAENDDTSDIEELRQHETERN